MNIYCIKCFTIIRLEVAIAPTGSKVKCSGCGSTFTIYPSKTVISDFWAYVIGNYDVSVRACSMIRNYVHDVDVFLRSSREDFLEFRNCGFKTTNELIRFQRELRKNLGYGAGGMRDALKILSLQMERGPNLPLRAPIKTGKKKSLGGCGTSICN